MANRKKKNLLPNSWIVTQSNQLIEARYNLPLAEQRLVMTMISKIQPEDEDFKPYRIRVNELAEFLGISSGSAYYECKKITESLLKRVISIQESDGLLQIGWVSSAKYMDGSGMVNLSFDPLLKPYLLQLKSNFTSCKLAMLLSFKSQYTVRIYTLLKQYERLKQREIEIDRLRELLGLEKEQYKLYADFKRYILFTTQNELTEKADLYFEFEEIKYGRRIGAILFRIFKRDLPALLPNIEESELVEEIVNTSSSFSKVNAQTNSAVDRLLLLVPEQHRIKKTVISYIIESEKKQGFEYVRRNILYCNAKAEKSYAGFLNTALKQDWGKDWQLEQRPAKKKKTAEIWERQGFKTQKEYDEFMFQQQMERYEKVIVD